MFSKSSSVQGLCRTVSNNTPSRSFVPISVSAVSRSQSNISIALLP